MTEGCASGNKCGGQRIWYLKAAADRRARVEQSARNCRCDLDFTTTKSGRPYTLVATKNQASYDRQARQRQEDLTHLAALDG